MIRSGVSRAVTARLILRGCSSKPLRDHGWCYASPASALRRASRTLWPSTISSGSLHYSSRIGSGQLRLLRITSPRSELKGNSSRICCKTEAFSFHDAPGFRALSYTWDTPYSYPDGGYKIYDEYEPARTRTIECDGQQVSVGANIYDALSHLVLSNVVVTGDWLWIDAICINQDDAAEKTAQVARMGDVYSQAREVLIWLGPVQPGLEEEFSRAMILIHRFLETLTEMAIDAERLPDHVQLEPADLERVLGLHDINQYFIHLAYFLKHCRWFDRVWTMQELALNANPRMFCGHHEFSWAQLSALINFMRYSDLIHTVDTDIQSLMDSSLKNSSIHGVRRMCAVCAIRDRKSEHEIHLGSVAGNACSQHTYLALLLQHAWDAGCADRRDHVAGILGMAKAWYEPQLMDTIAVDYTRDAREAFLNVTSTILLNSQSLNALSTLPFEQSTDLEEPSWVFRPSSPACFRGPELWPEEYAASNGLKYNKPPFRISGHSLIVTGFHFDTVHDVARYDTFSNSIELVRECLRLGAQIEPVRGRSKPETIWRTLLMTESNDDFPSTIYTPQFWNFVARVVGENGRLSDGSEMNAFEHQLRELRSLLNRLDTDDTTVQTVLDKTQAIFKSPVDEQSARDDIADFTKAFPEATPSLFTIQKGLIGLGPSHARHGDQIWVLACADIPFVLRPCNVAGTYKLIGHCFFLDHMHGEMPTAKYGYVDEQSNQIITID